MRPEIAKQITSLRLKGLGYKSIAVVVGTSKENVRYYCKTHGLDGKSDLVKLNFEEHKKHPEVCKHCGGKIIRQHIQVKRSFAQMHAAGLGGKNIRKSLSIAKKQLLMLCSVIVSVFSIRMVIKVESIAAMIAMFRIGFGQIRMRK